MSFNRYSIYPSAFGAITLRDMSDFNFSTASNKSVVIPGGNLHPQAVVNCCADPMATFSTKDFDTVFGGSPSVSLVSGYAVNSSNATVMQFQRRVDGSTFDSTGNATHTVGTNSKGFMYVSDISASQDDTVGAKISMEYVILSTDGITDPVTWSEVSTLSSSPNFNGIYYLGPVMMGTHGSAAVLSGVQSVSIKTGINYKAPRADGNVYPVNGSIYSIIPEIRIRTLDFGQLGFKLGTYGSVSPWANAFAASTTSLLFYFQKGVHGGSRVASNVASHYLVTASTGDNTLDSVSVQQVDDATTEVIIRPTGGLTMTALTTIA